MDPSAGATAPPVESELFPSTLPTGLAPIIGREREVHQVLDLLEDGAGRLVTLTGAGGVGKTRIAAEVAGRLSRRPLFVALSAITEASSVLPEVARLAGWKLDESDDARSVIRDALAGRAGDVVVLDTAEHLPGLAAELTALLAECPGLTLLVTSRIPLRAPGEHVVEVAPLPVVAAGDHVSVAEARENESVALLVQGVHRAGGVLDVTEANVEAVLEICRRVDGLPLAIELASARMRLVSPAQLIDLLDRPLAVLGGRAAGPGRTLRATIEWSVGLLDETDRARFTALGVFPGSFDVPAAAAVLGEDAVELLDSFATLLDHHLIRPAALETGGPRFELLDTLREFAAEQLVATGADRAARWALARWCADLAAESDQRVSSPKAAEALDDLDLEYASIHGALGWLADQAPDDPDASDLLLQMCGALWQFWSLRGRTAEGAAWVERAIASAGAAPTKALALAWYAAGRLAERRSDLTAADAAFTAAAELSEALGDDIGAAEAWNGIGMVARTLGDHERARAFHERALTVFASRGFRRQEATTLNNLAAIAYFSGDLERAATLWTNTAELLRETGDERARGVVVGNLGAVQLALGNLEAADACFAEASEIAEQFGDSYGLLTTLVNSIEVQILSGRFDDVDDRLARARGLATENDRYALAVLSHLEGRLEARRGHLGDAAALLARGWRQVLDAELGTEQPSSLEHLGMIAAEVGDHAAAATLLEAAARLRQQQLSDPIGPDAAALRHWTEVVERALGRPLSPGSESGEVDLTALSATIEDLVVTARGATRRLDGQPWAQRFGLTRREAEIAELLIERRTDREIADALILSRRTVTTHVSAILRKLGVSSRRDVATVLLADG